MNFISRYPQVFKIQGHSPLHEYVTACVLLPQKFAQMHHHTTDSADSKCRNEAKWKLQDRIKGTKYNLEIQISQGSIDAFEGCFLTSFAHTMMSQ